MRQPEVCKHQVCDHCGGRFVMVTHRGWGNKLCKRTCKNPPPRKSLPRAPYRYSNRGHIISYHSCRAELVP
jgi:hypothetical protein